MSRKEKRTGWMHSEQENHGGLAEELWERLGQGWREAGAEEEQTSFHTRDMATRVG